MPNEPSERVAFSFLKIQTIEAWQTNYEHNLVLPDIVLVPGLEETPTRRYLSHGPLTPGAALSFQRFKRQSAIYFNGG